MQKSWMRERLGHRRDKAADPYHHPPILPRARPPPHDDGQATAQSAFFQRLPVELRRMALVAAFGDTTLHMHLEHNYPPVVKRRLSLPWETHLNLAVTLTSGLNTILDRDNEKAKEWLWWGCVCHRNPPKGLDIGWPDGVPPWRDSCLNGGNGYCELWPGEWPEKCRVGCMGWLRSCRQAYVEGVDVLYATNTMHITTLVLVEHAPSLFLRQSLSRIKSLELIWRQPVGRYAAEGVPYLEPYAGPEDASAQPCPETKPLMSLTRWLLEGFPGLKELYLSLEHYKPYPHGPFLSVGPYPPREHVEDLEQEYLTSVDEMVRRLGPGLKDCSIALPDDLYSALRKRALRAGVTADSIGGRWTGEGFWRGLGDDEAVKGYWIREGPV
ncbi:uncharacterized protein K452DRAFT_306594 [Aplosporella prunicola CBS 121167]|uniref:DUF7730 domain-containing protein n=1 Tax=Aplosporella prunicola CBS 121167 TaxID=1176127 RepID=A0A6A6BN43_9PEZI|nr:uncharacterized protein K452DRAFT_306594 [Aplosporella prunicola CBS 121167]KAF2144833.1 hypothetical protein K452DRAFT_306594 [Aplosporella prunicola CBS 121167]